MSRSYKKHGYSPICSSYGDKWYRKSYHHSERQKVKRLLRESEKSFMDDYNSEPYEKILTKGKDYSLRFADKWSWGSDGGAYWQDDKSNIRKDFDKAVFSGEFVERWTSDADIWSQYKNYCEKKSNAEKPTMMVVFKKVNGKETYYDWWTKEYRERETYDKATIKVPYNKAHRFDCNLIPSGYTKKDVSCIYKSGGYGWSGDGRWDKIIFGMIPTTLQTCEELVEWLRNHEEKMIDTVYRRRFGK